MSASEKPPTGLAGEALTVRYDRRLPAVLETISLRIPEGKITALIGPNGSGKSTLLKTLARQLTPESGNVFMDGRDLRGMPARELARNLGILFQEHPAPGDITIEELIAHGRYSHGAFLQGFTDQDQEAIEQALKLTDLTELRHRPVTDLSGGQRQLAWIAMALAQEPRYLFLDEPTTFLDLAHQFDLMELIVRLNREHGKTVVLVLHDLNLAARYADHLTVMKGGAIFSEGAPSEIVTEELLRQVFEIEARITLDESGHLHCIPTGKARTR